MEAITESDVLKMVRNLMNFPFPQICRHSVALDLLELLESKGCLIPNELTKAVVKAHDIQATVLIDDLLKRPQS